MTKIKELIGDFKLNQEIFGRGELYVDLLYVSIVQMGKVLKG